MNIEETINALRTRDQRCQSVLLLTGTGIDLWPYYPFLHSFSLEELAEIDSIYGISGGAVCFWYYCLHQMGLFDESAIDTLDEELRSLNKRSLCHRFWQLLRNQYVYDAGELAERIESFACRNARLMRFGDFPLRNFTAIGHDNGRGAPVSLNGQDNPDLIMGDALAAMTCPHRFFTRNLCRPLDLGGMKLSDLNAQPKSVRRGITEEIKQRHRDKTIYVLNVFFEADKGHVRYINASSSRYPRLTQLRDLLLLILNIPNRRIGAAVKQRLLDFSAAK